MEEKKYELIDELGHPIATNMDLDVAFCLIKGYTETFYNQPLNVIIRQVEKKE